MKFKRPRGTNDLFGDKISVWQVVERELIELIRNYGYSEIRTPIFEMTDLFVRAVGEGSDIVAKEMYTFEDKKGRSLTLRPENTAPVMRALLENGLHRTAGIKRFYYLGPMFRYDRPQAGRYRQFHQIGAEAIGSQDPSIDAEVIDLSLSMYRLLRYPELDVRLNSVGCPNCRPSFKDVLKGELEGLRDELCGACRDRAMINPLRIFDCKSCDDVKHKLPVITEHLCGECADHFGKLQHILDGMGINYSLDPLLVRGLDYYTKTAFEILHPGLGAQNALCGGGRYDGLAEDCGASFIPAIGFSAGMERLIETLPEEYMSGIERDAGIAYFAILDDSMIIDMLLIARELRLKGISTVVDLSGRSVKKQIKSASDGSFEYVVIIGSDEIERKEATVKSLESGEQESIPLVDLQSYLCDRVKE
jgi:histidyl-tRNA synthetase